MQNVEEKRQKITENGIQVGNESEKTEEKLNFGVFKA